MRQGLHVQMLEALGARWAVLSAGRYALAVRFRVCGTAVECRVPSWTGVGDLLPELDEVMLVAFSEVDGEARWLFVRGPAAVVPEPDWAGLEPASAQRVASDELYQVLRIQPVRLELVDEARGWGIRETLDL